MNKKSIYALGLASGIILGSVGVGYAANQYVQAILNQEIKVSLNGQVQNFKDASTGETMYPLTYKDRTYLPLRNVAETLGLDVDYDNETKTALLNKDVFANDCFNENIESYVENASSFGSVENEKFEDSLKSSHYFHNTLITPFEINKEGTKVTNLLDKEFQEYANVEGIDGKIKSFIGIYYGNYLASCFLNTENFIGQDIWGLNQMLVLTENGDVFVRTDTTFDKGIPTLHFEKCKNTNGKVLHIATKYATSDGVPFFIAEVEGKATVAEIDTRFKQINIYYAP